MDFWAEILFGVLFTIGLYAVMRLAIFLFSRHELKGRAVREQGKLTVVTDGDGAEYYTRLALLSVGTGTAVQIRLIKGSAGDADAADTLRRLSCEYENLTWQWV